MEAITGVWRFKRSVSLPELRRLADEVRADIRYTRIFAGRLGRDHAVYFSYELENDPPHYVNRAKLTLDEMTAHLSGRFGDAFIGFSRQELPSRLRAALDTMLSRAHA